MHIIDIRDVFFRRGEREILSGISWAVQQGEHWALLGANGSGKTTLLKILTGYEWGSSGTVTVLGRRFGACHVPELRKHLGWVSSSLEHRLPGCDKAIDIVLSGLEASLGVYRSFSPEERAAAHQILAGLGGERLAQQTYRTLSQGEQQRVLIARALVSRPALLILDEPCAGLDPAARHVFLDDLAVLAAWDDAPSIVLVTHHIEEIGPWINRVMVLKEGKVLAQGPARIALSKAILGEAFGHPCEVLHEDGHYRLCLSTGK